MGSPQTGRAARPGLPRQRRVALSLCLEAKASADRETAKKGVGSLHRDQQTPLDIRRTGRRNRNISRSDNLAVCKPLSLLADAPNVCRSFRSRLSSNNRIKTAAFVSEY